MNQNPQTVPAKRDSAVVEYVPFGAKEKIKLSISIVQNLICVKTKTGKTCTDNDAIKFMAMCQAKAMNPFEGDCYMIGYDTRDGAQFAQIAAHQTYLKRAEVHPEYDGMESGVLVRDSGEIKEVVGDFVDEGLELVGGWARVHFKQRKHPMYKRLKLSRFKKSFGVWLDDPAGMIVKCAEADALRSSFPTMLGGLYMREEIQVDTLSVSKPDFGSSGVPLFSPAEKPEQPAIESGQTEPHTEKAVVENSTGGSFNYVKALRGLCKMSGVGEGALLDYLTETGSTDGSVTSIEELATYGEGKVLVMVHDSWVTVAAKIKEGK